MRSALLSATSLLALLVCGREAAVAVVIAPPAPKETIDIATDDDTKAAAPPAADPDLDFVTSLFVGYALTAVGGPRDASGPFSGSDAYVPTNLAPWARMATAQKAFDSAGDSVFIGTPDQSEEQPGRTGDLSGATETYTYSLATIKSGPARTGATGSATASIPGLERGDLTNAAVNGAPATMTTRDRTGGTADDYVYTPIPHTSRSVRTGISFTPGVALDPATQVDMPVELFPIAAGNGHSNTVDPADPVIAAGGSLTIPLAVVNNEADDLLPDPLPIFYDEASLLAVRRQSLIAKVKELVTGPSGVAVLGGSLAGLAGLAGLASLAFYDRRRKS